MDRSNSDSASSPFPNGPKNGSTPGPFAYQQRLLERTSSRGSNGSLARSGSISNLGVLGNPTGGSTTPSSTRRWTPSHRVSNSLDAVRNRWEERAKPENAAESRPGASVNANTPHSTRSRELPSLPRSSTDVAPIPPPKIEDEDHATTPPFPKRHTIPAPIIASPLSPNSTGVTVESFDSPSSFSFPKPSAQRIHVPSPTPLHTPFPSVKRSNSEAPSQDSSSSTSVYRYRRSNTLESVIPETTGSSTTNSDVSTLSSGTLSRSEYPPSPTSAPVRRRPTSLYNSLPSTSSLIEKFNKRSSVDVSVPPTPSKLPYTVPSVPPSPIKLTSSVPPSPVKPTGSVSPLPFKSKSTVQTPPSPAPTSSSTSSIMNPPTYRSPHMNKKYGSGLTAGRRLGRHLPRIASGDADDDWEEQRPEDKPADPEPRTLRAGDHRRPKFETVVSGVSDADEVAGIHGRLRLSRDRRLDASKAPLPSSRLSRGLWADVQRHLLQAYEYLCHVGEAQQWIEGCLGEELEFGVVEMEEGLRNGVVLARLARVFQGEAVVRRIYDAPKLDFRHSDNINYFFNFVREVGLPETFVFELTDLYEKKNLPKVIYCIHALSHLLARRGMAERIGNLLGHLQFSDDQLQATQKGLTGVAMPNFGSVGRELAKEINEDPEVEIETEDERRDRLLLENEATIIETQSLARAFLVRKAVATQRVRLRLAERYVLKLQAQCRGVLARRQLREKREEQADITPWAIALQAAARRLIARKNWKAKLARIKSISVDVVKVQAQCRGVLQRRKFAQLKLALRRSTKSVVKLQSLARTRLIQQQHAEIQKSFSHTEAMISIIALQAHSRGVLERRNAHRRAKVLIRVSPNVVGLQAHARGVIMRRRMRVQLTKLQDVEHVVIQIQAAVRTYLARKRLLALIRGLRRATPVLIGIQALARGKLARQERTEVTKMLSEVHTLTMIGGLQAFARAALTRQRRQQQKKQLEFVAPDVTGFQAAARGALVRGEYWAWRDHLHRNAPIATILQAMLRGILQRRKFHAKMKYYRTNLAKVVKIQSLFRGKETREQYRQLTLGKNVNVSTIKNFVHLLDDSEADFQEEIKVEQLRKKVVESIRENQALENDVNDLDVKIALVVQNVKSFEELIKARRRHRADSAAAHATRASVLAAHGDPFAGPNTLDHAARRKLELYQQLFYLLQTRGEYLSKLFLEIAADPEAEKKRRLIERIVLTLFGYGQDRREDYLFLKLFQLSIQQEISATATINEIMQGHPMYINIAVHYARSKQIVYVRETLQSLIRDVINADDLNLEADPCVIYRSRMDIEEMRSGVNSSKPKDMPFHQAIHDPPTRAEYIRHLQVLQWWVEKFVMAIVQSTKKIPYAIRYLARETLAALKEKYPDEPDEVYAACVGRLVYYRFINPAVITPETFDIVASTVDIAARKNLAQISKVLTQIASGIEFGEESPAYLAINEFVLTHAKQMTDWLLEVADVPDAENQYHAHEFLDATVQPKPIYISPNEVYAMHALLAEHAESIAPTREDILRVILHELDGVPHFGSDELKAARDQAITLELSNRFARVRDPQADEKALWVQAKRGVLAILRVQPAKDLVEALMQPVTDEHEEIWDEILRNEEIADRKRSRSRRQMPSTTGYESAYRMEDIRSLSFREVKAHAIYFLLELEKLGKITRSDGYQGILNAIAGDVRSKHRKRLQRQQEMNTMEEAMKQLRERKKYFEDQIDSYHKYVEAAMNTMQRGKGKKRFVMPFTKQFFHLRELQKSGKTPQFGSYKYGAQDLYDKGILLSIDQFSPRQFDKMDIIISSNEVGLFTIEVYNNTLGITNRVASQELKMEDLLQAQFENRASLSLFNGLAKVNLNLLLYQINKKFYV
ncbi:ras GTPase-activating protein [Neolentinus lepideus HHB14362 ss-1]|uniref:Ras GTPase-activating protein n=1 Tax=Neolentinus lepideus HHB14362 ss-1 TaxID=1314782 RepID=A0A165S110_9AGAM|nr:ras GTPase-activating protein [Neolentinus lepideus HHB14362 ss-1]